MHSSIMLSGIRGIGKAMIATQFAEEILGQGTMNRIESGSHPDFMHIKSTDGKEISVEEVRRLQSFISTTAAESTRKVVIIDSIDELNRNAANALLKILEEPPLCLIMILVSHEPWNLLPTIRSRVLEIRVRPPGFADFVKILENLDVKLPNSYELQKLYCFCNGSIGMALHVIQNNIMEIYNDSQKAFEFNNDTSIQQILEISKNIAKFDSGKSWHMARFFFTKLFAEKIRNSGDYSNTENLYQAWGELEEKLMLGEAINLDKQSVILPTLAALN